MTLKHSSGHVVKKVRTTVPKDVMGTPIYNSMYNTTNKVIQFDVSGGVRGMTLVVKMRHHTEGGGKSCSFVCKQAAA